MLSGAALVAGRACYAKGNGVVGIVVVGIVVVGIVVLGIVVLGIVVVATCWRSGGVLAQWCAGGGDDVLVVTRRR